MRIRSRKNLSKKNKAIVCLFLVPIIGLTTYIGMLVYILMDISSWPLVMPPPDTDYFYDMDDINVTLFEQMAENYEARLEKYHMPTNISQDITYTDNTYSAVAEYHGTDNANLHIGYTMLAECLKYQVAVTENNEDNRLNATRMIKKLLSALIDFMAAPNGGFGINPETGKYYPGTLARFVAAPGTEDIHGWLFDQDADHPHYKHFNGTGDYSNWRVRLYTSRDELGGFYLSLASVLKWVDKDIDDDSFWCWNVTKVLATQMIEGFRNSNWLMLGGIGEPVGSDLNPVLEGSTWQLALLRIGATADPEKYMSLYHYCVAKMQGFNSASMGDPMGFIGGYYAYSFGLDVMITLIWLEEDPLMRFNYIQNYENNFYSVVRYHRNNFFNAAHLMFMTMITENQRARFINPDYSEHKIKWDVLDNMWRFHTSGWTDGIRNYNLIDRPHSTRATSTNPLIASMERTPNKRNWREFFETSMFGPLFSWIEFEWDFGEGSELYTLPLTVSEYGVHHWLWEHNKFDDEGGSGNGNGLHEAAPNSFIAIYWMLRAYNLI